MEALNRLIQNLGANRVTMSISTNEFEQTPADLHPDKPSEPGVLAAIVKTCDPDNTVDGSIQTLKANSGIKVSKKYKEVMDQCWHENENRLIHLNDCLLDHFAVVYKKNIVVVVLDVDNDKFGFVYKGVVCNKSKSPSCCITATHDLIATSVQSMNWQQVKELLIEKKWVDAQFVSKCLSAAEVKQLAEKMGHLNIKGVLKKDLVSIICDTLQKN